MIENISDYVSNLITLVILITIIELILPSNKNKKYIMFVSSLTIMLSVINPILKVFGAEIDIRKEINKIQEEISDVEYKTYDEFNLNYNIYNTYIEKLKNNMITRIEEMGYEVLNVEIKVNKETYEPENIEMDIKGKK